METIGGKFERLVTEMCFGMPIAIGSHPIGDVDVAVTTAHQERLCLGPKERAICDSIRSNKRRVEFCAGRAAVRKACRKVGLAVDARMETLRDTQGAPFIDDAPGYHVSISHSGGLALAAISTRRIGIDLEQVEERPAALLRYFMSAPECEAIAKQNHATRHDLINELWCRKEAACKVGRWGARLSFQHLDCTHEQLLIESLRIELRSTVRSGYACAIALEASSSGSVAAEASQAFSSEWSVQSEVSNGAPSTATVPGCPGQHSRYLPESRVHG